MTRRGLLQNSEFLRLCRSLQRLLDRQRFNAFQGVVYRSVEFQYAKDRDLFSGRGALFHAGRWNARGAFRVVHGSETPELALAETLAVGRRYGFRDQQFLPRVTRALSVRLSRMIDLREPNILRSLRVSRRQLCSRDWWTQPASIGESVTQMIGRAAFESGFEGMIVPSAESRKQFNLIIFPDNLLSRSKIEPADAGL